MSIVLLDNQTTVGYNVKKVPELSYVAIHITGTATVEISVMAGDQKIPIKIVTSSIVFTSFNSSYKIVVRAEVLSIGASSSVSVEV